MFHPLLTFFGPQKRPFSSHFAIFRGQKRATKGSKQAKTTCFGIPRGLGQILKTAIFFTPVHPIDPLWAFTRLGSSVQLAAT